MEAESSSSSRLADAKSPYLRQHADNAVRWYPWGEEALQKARAEDKPIFLSVGYSTCHWCHVMERESFEDQQIGEFLNQHFVPIKVDREERPDIDRVYMEFIVATQGGGGWPMSVFLTPDLKPFFGGTYFPPRARRGQPGFDQVLRHLDELWRNQRERVEQSADEVATLLKDSTLPGAVEVDAQVVARGYAGVAKRYDVKFGGFGKAPKFPQPASLDFLLRYGLKHDEKASEMALESLRAMARGGIYDHLGGGFHRYSTDNRWHVPHFEKMLYDQALLAPLYLDAFALTGEPLFERAARGTLDYVARELRHEQGGFFCAQDADSAVPGTEDEHAEGAFYVFTSAEFDQILAEKAEQGRKLFGVRTGGNVEHDPSGELLGKNVLFLAAAEDDDREIRRLLLEARSKRPVPHTDDKILTAWNGMMIAAFARGYEVLGEEGYLQVARGAADFVAENLLEDGQLYRHYRQGRSQVEAFADDYAEMVGGLLALFRASGEVEHLRLAMRLQASQNELFWDAENGGYFETDGRDPSVLKRGKDMFDSAVWTSNSRSLMNLNLLAQLDPEGGHAERSAELLAAFSGMLNAQPQALTGMLSALATPAKEQLILAGPDSEKMRRLLAKARAGYHPERLVLWADGGAYQKSLAEVFPVLNSIEADELRLYRCRNFSCDLPVDDVAQIETILAR